MSDIVFLPKPFETKDLLGIVRKQLKAGKVAQQRFRRFATSQDAEIQIESTGGRLNTRVRNLSKGGAYLEFMIPSALKVGEFLTVKLELKDLQRTYTFPAKVVWSNRHGSRGLGIGVEFTGRGDVQRSILGL
jgi:Tfp pilus assembly protein PilZ